MASSSDVRKNILSAYKKLLILAKFMQEPKKSESICQIREQFRRNSAAEDTSKITEMLKKANSSISFMKMITPKPNTIGQSGVTRIVFSDADGKPIKKVNEMKSLFAYC